MSIMDGFKFGIGLITAIMLVSLIISCMVFIFLEIIF